MFKLKRILKDAIPHALEKAERYRLLNEPGQAESICHDILEIDPNHQQALITLILALTDRFLRGFFISDVQPQDILPRLQSEYDRAYYAGIIYERKGKAKLDKGGPQAGYIAYDLLCEAMSFYEKAEALQTSGNNDPILRWNACARVIMQNKLVSGVRDEPESMLE